MDGGLFSWLRRPTAGERLRAAHVRDDLVEAADRAAFGRPCEAEVAALATLLTPEEVVQQVMEGRHGKVAGVLALTTRRILFVAEGAAPQSALIIDRADVLGASGQEHRGLSTLALLTRSSEMEVDQVLGNQAVTFAENTMRPPAEAVPSADPLTELAELRARHQAGEIGDTEFETRKRQLFEQI
ncbi:hypothetical protein Kisp01_19530 [Kineosporia sp. NBRC 101677]|uniref:SHOCT domain-containing protein n=1 Tax=Kineosporia sp. NBRC 101677 TaxID=3032197 RepID=UPI0024A1EFF4|nr:SHOCT domain-containing protein [Kineosporia sp. NBRC 101677]GLY14938.1 hypothetical protein Kisp01_19530 [Kineosporia sp. NBRC 101677]